MKALVAAGGTDAPFVYDPAAETPGRLPAGQRAAAVSAARIIALCADIDS
jgi:hypothetical protein